MSSGSHATQDASESARARKRRRPNFRACDTCRKRKVRCDGPDMPGKECSSCLEHQIECVYTEGQQLRETLPLSYYKTRALQLEDLIRRFLPAMDINAELEKLDTQQSDFTWESGIGNKVSNKGDPNPNSKANATIAQCKDSAEHDGILLPDDFSRMHLSAARFHGKSSGAFLIQHAMKIRNEKTGVEENLADLFRNEQAARLWSEPLWKHHIYPKTSPYTFPDQDLMMKLIEIYFSEVNVLSPLFHRPTFDRCILEKLHSQDESFGAVVLLVCANAAGRCDDPRVLHPDTGSIAKGWQWFQQVRIHGRAFIAPGTLQELQVYILIAEYVSSGFSPQGAWILIGLGLRAAQDVGAHRQRMYAPPLTVEKELWRRAWWIMIRMDRGLASSLGRPLAIPDEEFDVELPIECDDEYWEHPDSSQAWKQPPGKPAAVSHFVQSLKLNHILTRTLRTVYAVDKAKMAQGLEGEDWEPRVVAELDSSLNMWINSLPDHLRWDPQCEDPLWFRQSVMLHAEYYVLQILVHMPFITTKKSPLSFPSLAICTNAARACSHLIDPKDPRLQRSMSTILWPMFISAIVLLLNVWGGKNAGLEMDSARALRDIRTCQEVMRRCEERFKYLARRLWHVLQILTSDLHQHSNNARINKRTRDGVSARISDSHSREVDPPSAQTLSDSSSTLAADIQKISLNTVHESLLQSHFQTLPLSTNDLQQAPLLPEPSTSSPLDLDFQLPAYDTDPALDMPSSLPPQGEDNPTHFFSQAMQQLPFFDVHGDWGSSMFGGMPGILSGSSPEAPLFSPSSATLYQEQRQAMEHDDPVLDTAWQQPSNSPRQKNWESYLSNVSELLRDIDSWERPPIPPQ